MFEVMSAHRGDESDVPDVATLPSPHFILREPVTSQAVELAKNLHNKGISYPYIAGQHLRTWKLNLTVADILLSNRSG